MLQFALRRIAFILIVSFGTVFFSFLGVAMAVNSSVPDPSYDPVPLVGTGLRRSISYVGSLATGNWGTMAVPAGRRTRVVSVGSTLLAAYPKSVGLLLTSLALATALGVPLGVAAALRHHSPLSLGLMTWTILGISLPSFCLVTLLQIGEIYWYRTFGFRLVPSGGFGWDAHIVMPALVLAVRPLAYMARLSFTAFAEILDEDYVRTAHAKGLLGGAVLRAHASPNALVPLLAAMTVSWRFSLASLPLVEYVLGWPGLGAALLTAIRSRQDEAVAGMALALGWTLLIPGLLLDLLARRLDPRIRALP